MNIDENNYIQTLSKKFKTNPIVLELLFLRGYKDEESISEFLYPSINKLNDPFLLTGMDKFVQRINKAISQKEKVLIFGDYDVDGVSATAIFIKYFASKDFYVDYYLPNRYTDGYGLTNEVLDKIKREFNPNLIITVDCGISTFKEVMYAKSIGIEIIITDHHDIPEILPDTLIINPKIKGQSYPFTQLCGTGVALKVVQALSGIEEAKKYLSIAAIATIADIVPLVDENRIIVSHGIKLMESTLPYGLKQLFKDNKLNLDANSTDIAFKISPKINAAGRMGDAGVALKLYLEENKIIVSETVEKLNALNTTRQEICNKIYDEAITYLSKINISNYLAIVLSSKNWDSGVLGIVAAKIAGEFNRPTVLFSQEGELLKGSVRSINDIDVHLAISQIKEVTEAFGGHKMAAGITIKASNYKAFIESFNNVLKKQYSLDSFSPKPLSAIKLQPQQITMDLLKDLNILEPFGLANEKPLFDLTFDKVNVSAMPKHPAHLNIVAGNLSILAFNSAKYTYLLKNASKQNIIVELQQNEFRGKKNIKCIAKSITTGNINKQKNDLLFGQYIKQLVFTEGSIPCKEYDESEFKKILQSASEMPIGHLFIANTYESYKDFTDKYLNNNIFYNQFLSLSQNNGFNTILLAPIDWKNFSSFNKIILLDPPLDNSYLKEISMHTKAKFYIPKTQKFRKDIFLGLTTDRAVFGEYFKYISNLASKKLSYIDEFEIYKQLKIHFKNQKLINYKQFVFCLYTFIELGIFALEKDEDFLVIKENKKIVSALTNSAFFNRLNFILQTMGDK